FNRYMEPMEFEAEGFLAVVLQHEIDHLNGKVFLDRMKDFSTLTHLAEFDHYWMSRPTQAG
ncbi:MAG TPA: peptide deformylase, partial [Candidatus Manganitrophaceae bacterium]|nr:peptide deformylase [Candidatus Manganitrophaceae bacterium]